MQLLFLKVKLLLGTNRMCRLLLVVTNNSILAHDMHSYINCFALEIESLT